MKSKRAREAIEAADPDVAADDVPSKKRKTQDTNGQVETNGHVKKSKKDKSDKEDKKDKKKKKHEKETRKEKKEKRKDIADLPQEDGPEQQEEEPISGDQNAPEKKDKKKDKKDKKEKKEKKSKSSAESTTTTTEAQPITDDPIDLPDSTTSTQDQDANAQATASGAPGDKEKNDRHIVFVGNLPSTATAASISAHFASLSPIAVRCLKEKGADKPPCRGIAFVEFGKVWHMRTCLDKFHHSWFDDGVGGGRKIRVELTAGGGGKTKQRQEKIKQKNKKLEENRTKRIEKEKTAKAENAAEKQNGISEDAIHPSRRGRMGLY